MCVRVYVCVCVLCVRVCVPGLTKSRVTGEMPPKSLICTGTKQACMFS